MSSAWVEWIQTGDGVRYKVRYRVGGRESAKKYGGTFRTMKEARMRRDWIAGELANMRVPNLKTLKAPAAAPTVKVMSWRWWESRVDVVENTRLQHRSAISNMLPLIGELSVDDLTVVHIAELVAELSKTRKRETVRKTLMALAMILDFACVSPNPARDKIHVRLPREDKHEIVPPLYDHVREANRLLPRRYRLPLVVIDATAMRRGEVEGLAWGDVDEPRSRWRVTAAVSKTNKARWIDVPPFVFEQVTALVPREDRTPDRQVFMGFKAENFATALRRACVAAGVPLFTPHEVRHRRISLMHLVYGVPWARIGEAVGQSNISVTADTYTHVLIDTTELDYAEMLA